MWDPTALDELSALRLQVEWGADEALDTVPTDRLRATGPVVARSAEPAAIVPAQTPVAATTLDDLHAALSAFEGCALRATATHTVRPSGHATAGLVVIGEAPGADDDRTGEAFAGAAGQQLDRILGSAGLDRTGMLLTHLVPWRPPGNRIPSEAEVRACLPFLYRLLQIVRPRRLVLLGQGPARVLLNSADPVRRLRGRWHAAALPGMPDGVSALCMAAPDQWLRSAASKRETWSDLLLIRSGLDVNRP